MLVLAVGDEPNKHICVPDVADGCDGCGPEEGADRDVQVPSRSYALPHWSALPLADVAKDLSS